MTKITAEHLGRGAFVYIRQSTADQLLHNHGEPPASIWARRSCPAARLDHGRGHRR